MAQTVRVVPEDLEASATRVDAHTEELHARRTAAAVRLEAAQPGVPARAAAALSAAVSKWRADTERHVAALTDHGKGLGLSAAAYRATEDRNAADVASLGREA